MPEVVARPDEADELFPAVRSSSGRRGRRRGVEVRPGSVKQARRDAGLSLGQVAGKDISRTAIYFVETGKAKPSIETLQLIATRTGRPLDYFLIHGAQAGPAGPAADTMEIDRLLASGENAAVVSAGESALENDPDAETAARIKFLVSTAQLRLAQPLAARRHASAARSHFEHTGDLLMAAECLGNEASAAYVMEDPTAIRLAEEALATCRSMKPVPVPTEARLLSILGNAHLTNHDWPAAISAYEEATAAAGVVQDLRRLSLLYSGMSMAYQEMGQFSQASHFAQRALTIHQTLNDQLSLARSENNLGLLLLRAGEIAAARPHLARAIRLFEEAHVDAGRANVLLSLCEFALAERDLDEADRLGRDAVELSQNLAEYGTVADAYFWLAKVAEARQDDKAVDAAFAACFQALAQQGAAGRTAGYHAAYAEILEGRGDLRAANDHLKLALAASRPGASETKDFRAAIA